MLLSIKVSMSGVILLEHPSSFSPENGFQEHQERSGGAVRTL